MAETERGGIDIDHDPLLGMDLRTNPDQTLVLVLDQKGMQHNKLFLFFHFDSHLCRYSSAIALD